MRDNRKPISDVASWLTETSAGAAPFPTFEKRGLPPSDTTRIVEWQFGAFSDDLSRLRSGEEPSRSLLEMWRIVHQFRDASGYPVYRALRVDEGPVAGFTSLYEPLLSSWSLKPMRALLAARAGGDGPFMIVRDRIGPDEQSLYVDDFEDKVIRGPFFGYLRPSAFGLVPLGAATEMVYVADVTGSASDASGSNA